MRSFSSNIFYLLPFQYIYLYFSLSLSLSSSLSLSLSLSISLSFFPISLGFSPIVNLRMQRIFWIGCSIGFFWSKKKIFGRPQICSRVRPLHALLAPGSAPFPHPSGLDKSNYVFILSARSFFKGHFYDRRLLPSNSFYLRWVPRHICDIIRARLT